MRLRDQLEGQQRVVADRTYRPNEALAIVEPLRAGGTRGPLRRDHEMLAERRREAFREAERILLDLRDAVAEVGGPGLVETMPEPNALGSCRSGSSSTSRPTRRARWRACCRPMFLQLALDGAWLITDREV